MEIEQWEEEARDRMAKRGRILKLELCVADVAYYLNQYEYIVRAQSLCYTRILHNTCIEYHTLFFATSYLASLCVCLCVLEWHIISVNGCGMQAKGNHHRPMRLASARANQFWFKSEIIWCEWREMKRLSARKKKQGGGEGPSTTSLRLQRRHKSVGCGAAHSVEEERGGVTALYDSIQILVNEIRMQCTLNVTRSLGCPPTAFLYIKPRRWQQYCNGWKRDTIRVELSKRGIWMARWWSRTAPSPALLTLMMMTGENYNFYRTTVVSRSSSRLWQLSHGAGKIRMAAKRCRRPRRRLVL